MVQNKAGTYPTRATFMNGSLTMFVQPRLPDLYSNISLPAAKSTQFMRLEYDGHLRLYEWSDDRWTAPYEVMNYRMGSCDYPTVCGEYGTCKEGQCACPLDDSNSRSSYFKPVDESMPNSGCTPITPISCQEIQHHRLLTIPSISYFDSSYKVVNATSINDCKQACLKNCSCMAVFFSPDGCVWVTKVFSL
jgi:hypothetical protein